MPDPYDWQMARRVARLAAHAPGRGLSRTDLAIALGETWNFDVWVKLAYVTRRVDCIRNYVVAPTLGPGAQGVAWEVRGTPQSPRDGNGPLPGVPQDTSPGRGPALF